MTCGNTVNTADHNPCIMPAGHRTGDTPTACRSVMLPATHTVTLSLQTEGPEEWAYAWAELSEIAKRLGRNHPYITVSSYIIENDEE